MAFLKLVALSVFLIHCIGAQRFTGQFQREGGRDLLSELGSAFRHIRPSISSGLNSIAGGVHNILESTRDAVHKLTSQVSIGFNAQIGHNNGGGNENIPEPRPDHNNGNSQSSPDNYPYYEIPNQNNDRLNEGSSNPDNSNKNTQQPNDGEVVMYIENNFPVILLKENEIRR